MGKDRTPKHKPSSTRPLVNWKPAPTICSRAARRISSKPGAEEEDYLESPLEDLESTWRVP